MNTRDNALLDIRPQIPTIIEEGRTSTAERFQNTCLRPILKLQNDLILAVFKTFLQKRKRQFYHLSDQKKITYIKDGIARDQRLRNLLLGLIIGQFTLAEWDLFLEEESELRRRMSNLLVERILSQLDQLQ